jgi:ankyrin repeat protein
MVAADRGHLHIVRYLLDQGADMQATEAGGGTVLTVACVQGQNAVVELLLEAGADPATPQGMALERAVREGHVGVVRALLAHGCGDIDAQVGDHGRTALWGACTYGHTAAARVLLEAGADVGVAERNGRTPLEQARREGAGACVALLEVRKQRLIMLGARFGFLLVC